ncbi:enolase C-terminal domain-like protein [Flavobacterium sp.]|uniref:enolase C-terminal domain-like protein n=1 Tax=Flavobacterium sp. TaxID=239 RepID=UPI003D12CF83
MQLSWQKVKLPLKETFSIAYGNYSYREALIVTLQYLDKTGYGECTAIDYYGINVEDLITQLNSSKTLIESFKIANPKEFYAFLSSIGLSSFLKSALDCAYWDLFGKLEHKNFLELNKIDSKNIPESSITISVDTLENQLKKIDKSQWNSFKVKTKGLQKQTIEILAELGRPIAIDSNASFTVADCEWIGANALASKFTYWEQPMAVGDYATLKKDSYANWMADEDCQNKEQLVALKAHYNSINIKLVKCGGLTPALDLIATARALHFKIMIGCMTESTVGITAGAMLAPLVDYADLDGANLIAKDIAKGSQVINGKIELTSKPGLGIEWL